MVQNSHLGKQFSKEIYEQIIHCIIKFIKILVNNQKIKKKDKSDKSNLNKNY